ncbi:hypothetical protein NUACC21_24740 [Scytonema sp. NUACC21]
MVLPEGHDAVQQLNKNVLLYDLAQLRGTNAILSRIPSSISGVYAWYRRFQLEPSVVDDPDLFVKFIVDELCKGHSAPRQAHLPPAHRIILQPETFFSKEALLREFAADPSFRQLLFILLNNSFIFQQPLYIGKASNLYSRIRSHLSEGSILRERLASAGHNINRCRLLVIYTSNNSLNVSVDNSNEDNELDNQVLEESEAFESTSDSLIEDILSRLFLPSFTLRYG